MNISECKVSKNFFNYFIYICNIPRYVRCVNGKGKTYMASFFIASVCDYYSPYHFLYGRSVIFFITTTLVVSKERGKGERGWRKRDKSTDKRVRFIASLILFIDTRIALRLRSQRLRRRNLVVKLGRVKTRLALFTRAILPPPLVHFFCARR